ncbi:hypothetical protein TpMuguga_02g00032 [Theileria parva strain Muguga]|uniref:Uncharacterized protein n=1 Tax=Theileria parva TaxID=5875 RepID=Q4N6A5_THEPA|nr:uncharacterized protein TpMuguga_02g00032 [Theileria parva strain Muguga]EAN32318.1 hypothetical protein TpMuguga_02g00032 [Theileria parva strain Muguga]|eukprot:XP_764601.1 hypothetical protein [Theileria parva strain Muguga]
MTLRDIYGAYLRSNSIKLSPVRININKIKTTEKYITELKLAEINFNSNSGYGFRKVVKGFRTLWKAKGHREYATQIIAKSDENLKKLKEVTLNLSNGDIVKLSKQGRKWIQNNKITLDITQGESLYNSKYKIKMSTTMRKCHKKGTKEIESKKVLIKEFICEDDYAFDKIIETLGPELNQNVIWKKTERSVCAVKVSLALCSTDEKFMSLESRSGRYELFYWTEDTGNWERLTKSKLNLRNFKFGYDKENVLKFVEYSKITCKEKVERFSYMMYIDFPKSFEPKKEYSVAKQLEYNILENTIILTYKNNKTVVQDLKNEKINLMIKNDEPVVEPVDEPKVEPEPPSNDKTSIENEKEKENLATKFSKLYDSNNNNNFHSISTLNNLNSLTGSIMNEVSSSYNNNPNSINTVISEPDAYDDSKLCDNVDPPKSGNKKESDEIVEKVNGNINKLVVLNIDDKPPKNEFACSKEDNYKDYVCYDGFLINKIVENSKKSTLTKVVWSTNNPKEYTSKVSLFEVKNEKFLMIPFKDYQYKMFHKDSKNKSWNDITSQRIALRKLKLLDEFGIDIASTGEFIYKGRFTFQINPKVLFCSVKYRNINYSGPLYQENDYGKMNQVDVNVLENAVKYNYITGETKKVEIDKYFI